jgi:hypothetical protein
MGVYPADLNGLDFIGFDEGLSIRREIDRFRRASCQAEIAQGRLVALRLDAPELVRRVGILHLRRKKLNHAAQEFLEPASRVGTPPVPA